MESVFIKTEVNNIFLHITVGVNQDGKVNKLATATDINLPEVLCSTFSSNCPTCQTMLTINIITHDEIKMEFMADKPHPPEFLESEMHESELVVTCTGTRDNEKKEVDDCDQVDTWQNFDESDHSLSPTPKSSDASKPLEAPESSSKNSEVETLVDTLIDTTTIRPKGNVCVYCYDFLPSEKALDQHYIKHDLKCKFCDETHKTKVLLLAHVQQNHFKLHPKYHQAIWCGNCGKGFHATGFKNHVNVCTQRPRKPTCTICNKVFTRWDYIPVHMRTVHNQQKIRSTNPNPQQDPTSPDNEPPIQRKSGTTPGAPGAAPTLGQPDTKDTENPKIKEKRLKGAVCIYCFRILPSKDALEPHYIAHDLQCRFCEEKLPNRAKLLLHMRRSHFEHHPKSKTGHKCPNCNKYFSNAGFAIHKRLCTKPYVEPFCHICNKKFCRWATVTKHIEVRHKGIREFTCDECGAQFSLKGMLDEHKIAHELNDPMPYKCHLCSGLGFSKKALIKRHIDEKHLGRVKTTKRCSRCDKHFPDNHTLAVHMLTHDNIRPFLCSICSKGFYRDKDRRNHEKIHMDIREFSCDECGARFRQKSTLKTHQRLHSGEKPFVCEICSKGFSDRGCYRSHLACHEKELGITLDKSVKKFSTRFTKK